MEEKSSRPTTAETLATPTTGRSTEHPNVSKNTDNNNNNNQFIPESTLTPPSTRTGKQKIAPKASTPVGGGKQTTHSGSGENKSLTTGGGSRPKPSVAGENRPLTTTGGGPRATQSVGGENRPLTTTGGGPRPTQPGGTQQKPVPMVSKPGNVNVPGGAARPPQPGAKPNVVTRPPPNITTTASKPSGPNVAPASTQKAIIGSITKEELNRFDSIEIEKVFLHFSERLPTCNELLLKYKQQLNDENDNLLVQLKEEIEEAYNRSTEEQNLLGILDILKKFNDGVDILQLQAIERNRDAFIEYLEYAKGTLEISGKIYERIKNTTNESKFIKSLDDFEHLTNDVITSFEDKDRKKISKETVLDRVIELLEINKQSGTSKSEELQRMIAMK